METGRLHAAKQFQSQAANKLSSIFKLENSGRSIPYRSTMVTRISHYRQNIAVMASKKGCIKSLSTVEEPGTADLLDS